MTKIKITLLIVSVLCLSMATNCFSENRNLSKKELDVLIKEYDLNKERSELENRIINHLSDNNPIGIVAAKAYRADDDIVITNYSKHNHYLVRMAIANNHNTSYSILKKLSSDADSEVAIAADRLYLSLAKNTDKYSLLIKLSNHKDAEIRSVVANNINTPLSVLLTMLKDSQNEIQIAVRKKLYLSYSDKNISQKIQKERNLMVEGKKINSEKEEDEQLGKFLLRSWNCLYYDPLKGEYRKTNQKHGMLFDDQGNLYYLDLIDQRRIKFKYIRKGNSIKFNSDSGDVVATIHRNESSVYSLIIEYEENIYPIDTRYISECVKADEYNYVYRKSENQKRMDAYYAAQPPEEESPTTLYISALADGLQGLGGVCSIYATNLDNLAYSRGGYSGWPKNERLRMADKIVQNAYDHGCIR